MEGSAHPYFRLLPVKPAEEALEGERSVSDGEAKPVWERFADTVKVLTYNVLAEIYCSQALGTGSPAHALWPYRAGLLQQQLELLNPDIICLQEVDHFRDFFWPMLLRKGYDGAFLPRTGGKRDGCATFWKKSKWQLVRKVELFLNDVAKYEGVASIRSRTDNVALGVVLIPSPCVPSSRKEKTGEEEEQEEQEIKEGEGLLVVNTHLYWDPRKEDVKLLQLHHIVKSIEDILHGRKKNRGRGGVNLCSALGTRSESSKVILCGDFNSLPGSVVYNYATRGRLEEEEWGPVLLPHLSSVPSSTSTDSSSSSSSSSSSLDSSPSSPPPSSSLSSPRTAQNRKKNKNKRRSLHFEHELNFRSGYDNYYSGARPEVEMNEVHRRQKEEQTENEQQQLPQEPLFTNYTANFKGTLDYIFYTERTLEVVARLCLPPVSLLEREGVKDLPCPFLPSDHLPLLCCFSSAPWASSCN
ncbi:Nocturnin [Balamuthia mandrillaris]